MNFLAILSIGLLVIVVILIARSLKRRQQRLEQKGQISHLEQGLLKLQATVNRLAGQVARIDHRLAEVVGPPSISAERVAALVEAEEAAVAAYPSAIEPAPAPEEAPSLPLEMLPSDMLLSTEAGAAETEAKPSPVWATRPAPEFEPVTPPPPVPRKPGLIRRLAVMLASALKRLLGFKPGETVNWETLVGGRWLNLIGMLVLVVGIALLSQQALLYLDAMGKVTFGAGLGLAMLVGGVLLERSDTYRWIGRTLIGGGWALLYFVAYAAYNVVEAKVIDSPTLALVVLLAVAGGMLAHSLRYRAQVITGLTFGLAFLAIVLTPVTIASLVASAVLAAALVAVARVLSWHYLAVAGVLGTYANHWLWLQKITNPPAVAVAGNWLDASLPPEAVFWVSCGILAFYWVLFSVVSLRKSEERAGAEQYLFFVVSLLNTAGVALLLHAQVTFAFGQHYLWAISGPIALSCAGLAYLDRRFGQRVLFVVNAGLSLLAYSVTLPLAIDEYGWLWGWAAPYFAAGGLAAVAVGLVTKEPAIRLMGYGLALAGFVVVMGIRLWEPAATRLDLLWVATAVMVAAYQAASEVLRRQKLEAGYPAPLFGFAATLMLAGLVWIHLPHDIVAPVWMALGLLLFEFGVRRKSGHEMQGYVLMLMAAGAAILVNVYDFAAQAPEWQLPGWIYPGVVAAGLYYYFARTRIEALRPKALPWVGNAASAAASLLVALAAWRELPSLAVAPVWAVLGLALFEAGTRFDSPVLRAQAHIAMAAVFVRLFMANLVVDGDLAGISFRLLTVVPIVLIYIYLRYQVPSIAVAHLEKGLPAGLLKHEPTLAAGLYSWASAILVVMLFRFEFGRAHTVAAWAPLLLVLLFAGRHFRDRNLRFQSYALAVYAFFRGWSTNIYLDGYWLWGLPERLSTTVPMIAALFVASFLCRAPLAEVVSDTAPKGRLVRLLNLAERHAVAFFAALGAAFLGVLLYYQLPPELVSIGWAVEGMVLLVTGFVFGMRSYRVLGLTALFATLVKVVFVDLAGIEEIYRIMSFIVLGLILLLASVVYTRYRGLIEKYL